MKEINLFHKKRTPFFSFFIFLLFVSSCASIPQDVTTIVKRYCVGQGGGFTGEYIEYSFSEDGKVYKRDFDYERDVYYKDLSETDLSYFLTEIRRLGIESAELNHPGNISKYIEIRERESTINKTTWGEYNYDPPEDMVKLFNELYNKLSERP